MNLLGKLIRLPLKAVPPTMVVPILFGNMKGIRWVTGSSNHGYWLGWYEKPVRNMLEKYLSPGCTFLDLGAHVGYFALLGSKLVGDAGAVYAFEPLPANLEFLKDHFRLNNINNVTLYEGAIAHYDGEFTMDGRSRVGAKLSDSGDIKVKVYSLKRLLNQNEIKKPDLIKIDIEGAEHDLLVDIREYLSANNITILLFSHGRDVHEKCIMLLERLNYSFVPLDAGTLENCTEFLAEKKA